MPDIAVGHDITPFVSAYPWTPGTGFGVKYADPATLPTGDGFGVGISYKAAPSVAFVQNIGVFTV